MEDILFDLYYKSAHRNEELEQTIEELRGKLKYRRNENITLAGENNKLQDDLKQARNEIRRLNKQVDNIRAEIEAEPYISKMEVLDIIDKYNAENEQRRIKNNDNNI